MNLRFTWRLIALASLVVYVAIVFIALRLLVHHLVFTLVFGLTSVLLLYSAWLVVSSNNRTRTRLGSGLFAVALLGYVVEFVFFFSERQHIRSVVGLVVLSVLYVALIGLLRNWYWHMKREHEVHVRNAPNFRHPVLIINPKSGNGRAMKVHIDTLASKMGISVLMTKKDEAIEVTTKRAVREGADVLGIAGGDGSIGAVAKVALAHNLPMVVLPGGTRCHFARDLGLDPKRITDSLVAFQGTERQVDVADINRRIFLNNVSFGLYADIVDHPDYREHKLRVSLDVMRSIANGSRELYDLQFQVSGKRIQRAAEVLVGVNCYDMVNVFELGYRKHLDEGILQVTALTVLNDSVVKHLLKATSVDKLRTHADEQGVLQWTAQSFKVTNALGTIVVGVDGEREEYKTPVTIRILPKALRVYVPAEGFRQRQKNPFSSPVIRRVWWGVVH